MSPSTPNSKTKTKWCTQHTKITKLFFWLLSLLFLVCVAVCYKCFPGTFLAVEELCQLGPSENLHSTEVWELSRLIIIESVDSISRDGPDCPYM